MISRAFKALVDVLPCVAEEGSLRTQVPVLAISEQVVRAGDVTPDQAKIIVATSQRLFDCLALLDRPQLSEGRWQFVSFPAQLIAHSLLKALADEDQDVLEAGYWEQGAHRPDGVVEEQRTLLRALETRRVEAHRRHSPEPIRFVYVAWGLIRLDGCFLLHHREDKARRRAGNYVLPGGRFNLNDLPTEQQLAAALPMIQRAESPEALACLERTLVREIAEETGLRWHEHYQFRHWHRLEPYREVEGTRNNHAYTEYLIQIFAMTLTASGQIRLFDSICETPERFAWFSLDDLVRKQRSDGKTAYLDALYLDLGAGLREALEAVPEAFVDAPMHEDDTDAVDLPISTSSRLLRGRTGKEKPVEVVLGDDECRVLLGLGWHAKGLEFAELRDAVLLPSSWVKILGAEQQAAMNRLGEKLRGAGIDIIERRDEEFFRLSVGKRQVFFDESCFRYGCGAADGGGGRDCWFQLDLRAIDTTIGRTAGIRHRFSITRNTLRIIESIESALDPEQISRIKSGDIQRTVREQIDENTKPLGLRKFLRIEDKALSIAPSRGGVGN
jgi:8-oxo-dGTP pyrophosphatase MutT (NUDIX family)